ncbi:MAG TPA: hypothetical protein VGM95_05060 [Lactobacillaceae bacterium]|jgi:small-conductance mechanosensitive channel
MNKQDKKNQISALKQKGKYLIEEIKKVNQQDQSREEKHAAKTQTIFWTIVVLTLVGFVISVFINKSNIATDWFIKLITVEFSMVGALIPFLTGYFISLLWEFFKENSKEQSSLHDRRLILQDNLADVDFALTELGQSSSFLKKLQKLSNSVENHPELTEKKTKNWIKEIWLGWPTTIGLLLIGTIIVSINHDQLVIVLITIVILLFLMILFRIGINTTSSVNSSTAKGLYLAVVALAAVFVAFFVVFPFAQKITDSMSDAITLTTWLVGAFGLVYSSFKPMPLFFGSSSKEKSEQE